MSDLEIILEKLFSLGLEDTKRLNQAVHEHLEALNEVAIHEQSKTADDETVPLKSIISEFQEGLEEGSR